MLREYLVPFCEDLSSGPWFWSLSTSRASCLESRMCVKDEGTLKELPLQNLSYLNKNVPVSIWTFSLKKQKMVPKKKKHLREKSGAERVVRIFRARRRGRRRWRSSMALSLCANPTQQTLEMTCNELMCCWLPGRERSVGQWCHCVYNKQPALLQILKKQVTADCWQSWWMSSTAALSWVWDDVCVWGCTYV